MTQDPNWEQNPYSEFSKNSEHSGNTVDSDDNGISGNPENQEPVPPDQPPEKPSTPDVPDSTSPPVQPAPSLPSLPSAPSEPVPPVQQSQPQAQPSSYPYGTPPVGYGPPPYYGPPPAYGAPPPYPYGPPPYYGVPPTPPPMPPLTPLPLKEALRQLPRQYLKVLTKPSPATFAEEMNKASWDIVLVQIIGYGILAAIISAILAQVILQTALLPIFNNLPRTSAPTPALPPNFFVFYQRLLLGSSISNVVAIPLYFFLGVGIQFGLAKLFKGLGQYLVQSYTALLYQVPLNLLVVVLSLPLVFIPTVGLFLPSLISLPVLVYSIVLNIFAIMSVHRLSGGKASAVVLSPYGAYLLFICSIGVLYAILIFTIVSQTLAH